MGLWRVLSDLEEDGYETEWGLFSAEETGAPHQRIRVFILAHNKSFGIQGLRASWEQESEAYERQELSLRESQRELGNPASLRPRGGRENCEGEQSEVLGAGLESDGELAHPASGQPRQSQARNGGQDIGGGSEEELGNSARLDGKQSNAETDQVGRACEEDRGSSDVRGTEWPARPGEEQYEWEEPRVTEIERELGGEPSRPRSGVDPIANRVDRLRLLGNGVCVPTAELAWRTLWKQLNDKYDD